MISADEFLDEEIRSETKPLRHAGVVTAGAETTFRGFHPVSANASTVNLANKNGI